MDPARRLLVVMDPIDAQRYISDITATGDKRILLIDGEPVSTALERDAGHRVSATLLDAFEAYLGSSG